MKLSNTIYQNFHLNVFFIKTPSTRGTRQNTVKGRALIIDLEDYLDSFTYDYAGKVIGCK